MSEHRRPAHRARRGARPESGEPRGLRRPVWALSASVVLVGLLFVVGFPIHTYLQQRHNVSATQAQVERLARQNAALSAEVRRLDTSSEIERLAREEYGLVAPGEEAYALLPLAPGEKPLAGPARAAPTPSASGQAPAAGAASTSPSTSRGFWQRIVDELSF